MLINEQIAYYKQVPKSDFDQETHDTLVVLANDYRRNAKLLEIRAERGVDKVREHLNQLKKTHREKEQAMLKAQKEGKVVAPS